MRQCSVVDFLRALCRAVRQALYEYQESLGGEISMSIGKGMAQGGPEDLTRCPTALCGRATRRTQSPGSVRQEIRGRGHRRVRFLECVMCMFLMILGCSWSSLRGRGQSTCIIKSINPRYRRRENGPHMTFLGCQSITVFFR